MRPEPGGKFCGGLWVLEVESRAEAARLCEDDPYFRLGLRTGYRLYAWGKAPVYGDVILKNRTGCKIPGPILSCRRNLHFRQKNLVDHMDHAI